MGKKANLVLSLVLAAAAIGLVIATHLNRDFMRACLSRASYFIIFAMVLIWVMMVASRLYDHRDRWRDLLRRLGPGILVSVILSGIIFASVEPHFRVLSDETNMLAVSKSMTYEQRVENVTQGKWYYFTFNPIHRELSKRPFLFPFLTHVLHAVLGYQPFHPFVLNFILLITLFSVAFAVIEKHMRGWAGVAAIFLIAAHPVISQVATSAGYDLLFVLFMLISGVNLKSFLDKPSGDRFEFLWISLLLLANTRAEAFVFSVISVSLLTIFRHVKLDYLRSSPLYAATLLFMLPNYWTRVLVSYGHKPDEGQSAFSLSNFVDHNEDFLKSLIRFDFDLPYATVIEIVGVVSVFWLVGSFVLKKWPLERSARSFLWIFAPVFLSHWVVINAHFFPAVTHPSGTRFFALTAMTLSLLTVVFFWRIRLFREKPGAIVGFALSMFLLYHPVAVENRLDNAQTLPRLYRVVINYLGSLGQQEILIVANRPGQYTVHNYGAVDFSHARDNAKNLLGELRRHLFRDIYVIQEIEYKTNAPGKGQHLSEAYVLERVLEVQNKGTSYLRISRVKQLPHEE